MNISKILEKNPIVIIPIGKRHAKIKVTRGNNKSLGGSKPKPMKSNRCLEMH
jgi:hypothetical protein